MVRGCAPISAGTHLPRELLAPAFVSNHPSHAQGSWVELIRDQFPTHRGVKQDVHQILEMGLTFRRKREFLQRVFNEKRFDLVEETLSPLWLHVILEP